MFLRTIGRPPGRVTGTALFALTIVTMTMSKLEGKIYDDSMKTMSLPPVEAPEGGVRAWCTVAGGWLALFATFGSASSFGVFQDLYVRSGTGSALNVAWIGSVQLFLLTLMGLPAGKLLDKGYFRPVVLTGSVICVFSFYLLSFVRLESYYQLFLAQGVGLGLGSGLIYMPAMAVQAHYWQKRRALIMGIVITGSSFGGIVFPIMLNHLFNGSVGFAQGVRIQGVVVLALLAAANYLMFPPAQWNTMPEIPKATTLSMLKDVPFVIGNWGVFLIIIGLFFPYFYLQLYSDLHNIPHNFGFYTLTIQNGASVFGRIVPNILADRMGALNTMILMSLGTGSLIFTMSWLTTVEDVTAFALVYGFFSGGVLSLLSPTLVGYSRDISEVGARMGIGFAVGSLGFLSGPPISGALLSTSNHWSRAIIFSGAMVVSGIPFILASRHGLAKRKETPYI